MGAFTASFKWHKCQNVKERFVHPTSESGRGWVPDGSAKILTHRQGLKTKQISCEECEDVYIVRILSAALLTYLWTTICPFTSQAHADCHTCARPTDSRCPSASQASVKLAAWHPRGSAQRQPASAFLLTRSLYKLGNLQSIAQRTSVMVEYTKRAMIGRNSQYQSVKN